MLNEQISRNAGVMTLKQRAIMKVIKLDSLCDMYYNKERKDNYYNDEIMRKNIKLDEFSTPLSRVTPQSNIKILLETKPDVPKKLLSKHDAMLSISYKSPCVVQRSVAAQELLDYKQFALQMLRGRALPVAKSKALMDEYMQACRMNDGTVEERTMILMR